MLRSYGMLFIITVCLLHMLGAYGTRSERQVRYSFIAKNNLMHRPVASQQHIKIYGFSSLHRNGTCVEKT